MMDSVREQGGEVRDLEYKRNKKNQQQQQSSETSPLLPSKRQDLLEIGEEEEDDYHEASTPSAVFNLSTTIVGAGIMALPATMKVLGLPLGLLAILFAAILSENSIQALLRYSRPCKARSYGALMEDAFGEAGRIAVQLCIIINNVGILIVYIVIIGDVMSGTTGVGPHHTGVLEEWAGGRTWWNERVFVLFTTTVVILLPLCSFKHIDGDRPTEANGMWGSCDSKRNVGIDSLMASILYTWFAYQDLTYSVKYVSGLLIMACSLWGPCLADSLKWSSALSVALALVFVVITVAVALWKLVAGEIEWPRLTPDVHDTTSFWHLFTVVPVMVTAYICHHNVHPIANELEVSTEPSDLKMQKVVRDSLVLCTGIYLCTAMFAYLLFGEATSDDVLANFDTDLGIPFAHTIALIVRASYAVHIMLVFPLLHFSLRLNVDGLLFPKAHPLVHDNLRFVLLTGVLVGLIFIGSTMVPNIWVAFQFTGATASVCLAFIFPALILLKDKPRIATLKDKWEAWVMVILAVLSSVTAIASNILSS